MEKESRVGTSGPGRYVHEGVGEGDDIKRDQGEKGLEYSGIKTMSSGETPLWQKENFPS